MSHLRCTGILPALILGTIMVAPNTIAAEPDYGKEIQPLLAEHCYACHGPDAKTRKRRLRFDQREVAVSELKSGARAIVP
ncbi:MAG: c-type cytochrome domain-containing protein, partial [Roseibacillus sp.]